MPSNANPITLVAIVPKTVVRNPFFLLLKLGNINPISFCKSCKLSGYSNLSVVGKILHRGQFFGSVLYISIGNFS